MVIKKIVLTLGPSRIKKNVIPAIICRVEQIFSVTAVNPLSCCILFFLFSHTLQCLRAPDLILNMSSEE